MHFSQGKLAVGAALLTRAATLGIEFVHERAERAAEALADARRLDLLKEEEAARVSLVEDDAGREGALPAESTLAVTRDDLARRVC